MIYGLPEKQPDREISVLNRVIVGSAAAFAISTSVLVVSDSAQFRPDCEEFVSEANEDNFVLCATGRFGFGFETSTDAVIALTSFVGSGFLGVSAIGWRRELNKRGDSSKE